MLAIYYSVRAFREHLNNSHVKIYSDNYTAVSAINKMGTSQSKNCNIMAKVIWELSRKHGIWITCAHVPGVQNVEADKESRKPYKQSEWMLNPNLFEEACLV